MIVVINDSSTGQGIDLRYPRQNIMSFGAHALICTNSIPVPSDFDISK